MDSDSSFSGMLDLLRAGDAEAVRQFVATYEPYIRRTIRRRLRRTSLQAVADSADVCQSVLATFLVHVAAGSYTIHSLDQLTRLLMGIARRKFAALQRRELADCRDRRRTQLFEGDGQLPGSPGEDPLSVVVCRDLYSAIRQPLRDNERELFELRQQGHSWDSIAEQVGGDVRTLRQQLSRALRKVLKELGLEEND